MLFHFILLSDHSFARTQGNEQGEPEAAGRREEGVRGLGEEAGGVHKAPGRPLVQHGAAPGGSEEAARGAEAAGAGDTQGL